MIERKLIIGLITSTEFCRRLKDIWNVRLIESSTAKRIASWVWEYFEKYGKAPGKDMESIFYTKLKETKLPKDLAEEIEEDILPSLSDESLAEDFNLEYNLEKAEKYLNERHLQLHTDTVEALRQEGKIEEAEKLIKEFKPLGFILASLNDFILSVDQMKEKKRPHPITFIKPWLKEGQVTIIYGNFGTGKSLLTISVIYLLGLIEYDGEKCEVGEWQVKRPTGCLYIDGEIGQVEMEERIRQFEWLGKQATPRRLKVMCIPEYQLETEDSFFLSERRNQKRIINWLKENPIYKVVVLDSVSTLFGLIDENNNSEWNNKVNPFLRDLRALGVACLLLHHSGKEVRKGLRGASTMGAMAHNVFRIVNHTSKSLDAGEAWFVLSKDKQRAGGFQFKTFALHYYQTNNGEETHWEVTDTN